MASANEQLQSEEHLPKAEHPAPAFAKSIRGPIRACCANFLAKPTPEGCPEGALEGHPP